MGVDGILDAKYRRLEFSIRLSLPADRLYSCLLSALARLGFGEVVVIFLV